MKNYNNTDTIIFTESKRRTKVERCIFTNMSKDYAINIVYLI